MVLIMRRAQAAMEYLMTYGWALLVIVIVLGALVALQVLNPQARLQDTCNLPIGFKCDVVGLAGNGDLSIKITNQQAIPIEADLGCALGKNTQDSEIDATLSGAPATLSPGESHTFTCSLNKVQSGAFEGKSIGEGASGELFMKYNDGTSDKYVKGTFVAKVSQK